MTAVAVGNLPVEELIQVVEEGFETGDESARIAAQITIPDRSALVNEKNSMPSFTPKLCTIPSTLPEKPFAEVRRTELIDIRFAAGSAAN